MVFADARIQAMRTTLDIDDDVLQEAERLAASQRKTAGQVLSELARSALMPPGEAEVLNGVPLLPSRAGEETVTPEVIRQLQDETV